MAVIHRIFNPIALRLATFNQSESYRFNNNKKKIKRTKNAWLVSKLYIPKKRSTFSVFFYLFPLFAIQ